MKHCMTVRADGHQIFDWIDSIGFAIQREWTHMVDMNEAFATRAVSLLKIQLADFAHRLVVRDARRPRPWVALIPIHAYLLLRAIVVCAPRFQLIRVEQLARRAYQPPKAYRGRPVGPSYGASTCPWQW